jgi:hypothetical protein
MRDTCARVVLLGLLLTAAPAGAAGPRITVGPVQGDTKVLIPTQLAERLCGGYECVLWKEVSTNRQPDLAKARTRGVKGILTGVIETAAGGKKVTLSLFTTSSRPARTWTTPLAADGRLPAPFTRQLEQDLKAVLFPPAKAPPPAPAAVAAAAPAPPPPPAAAPPAPAAPAPAAAAPPPAARRWLLAAELGGFFDTLELTYGGVAPSLGTLRGFDATGLGGLALSLELFPLARGASALGGLGLHAALERSIGLETEAAPGDLRPTTFTRLEAGLRWRAPPLTGLELVLVPELAWVSEKLTVSPAIDGLPNSDLSGVRVALGAEARLGGRFTLLAGLGWVKWLTARELIEGEPPFFPGASAAGLEATAGAGVAIWGPLSVRLVGQYASTRYTLDPDPTGTWVATSAEERILGLRATLRAEY